MAVGPRSPSSYDNSIHGRKDFDDIDAPHGVGQIWNALAVAPPEVRHYFLRKLQPPPQPSTIDDLRHDIARLPRAFEAAAFKAASLATPVPGPSPDPLQAVAPPARERTPAASANPPLSTGVPEPPAPPPPPTERPKFEALIAAADKVGLIGVERRLVVALAEFQGRASLRDLNRAAAGDALSALRRVRPRLRKKGWMLFRRDSHIVATPIPRRKK